MNDSELVPIIDWFDKIYSSCNTISDFMNKQKQSILQKSTYTNLFPIEDDIFSEFHLSPSEMNLEIQIIPTATWENLLLYTSSHVNLAGSGKSIRLAIKETNTNKFIGLIRLGSPVINFKPRNELLGKPITDSSELITSFNDKVIMGFVIVPMQPFGYNYLGGKLLAGICCSHEIREIINNKYNTNICLFETSSLYGTTKSISQYDGMEPYIKFKGISESKFIPLPFNEDYEELKSLVDNIDKNIIVRSGTSMKLKSMNKIISLVKNNIQNEYQKIKFNNIVTKAISLTEQKRYYISTYGFKNSIDYILGNDDSLIKSENYDKFYLENIINWWKIKATKRYQKLISENKLRNVVEIQTSENLDNIR